MQNFIQFLIRFHALFLFLILEAFCLYLVTRQHHYQRAIIYKATDELTGTVYTGITGTRDYVGLKSVNDSLAIENARLRERLLMLELMQISRPDLLSDTTWMDSTRYEVFNYRAAKVINNSTDKITNFFTINKGSADGFRPEMGVIGPNGIVGVTKRVSENFTTAMSVLHKDLRISSLIKNKNYIGTLRWTGGNPNFALLTDIPKHVNPEVGDTVVTSYYSNFFPENLMIGTITDMDLDGGSNFYNITLRLSTNFNNIKHVYGVDFHEFNELKQLEQTTYSE